MNTTPRLMVDGRVAQPLSLTHRELAELDPAAQIDDVSQMGAKRPGRAVRFAALLEMAQVDQGATHLGLHGSRDDFHASIPLAPVVDRGLVIYEANGQPLSIEAGGPFRFFIPDHAACHTADIDECANVKFLDRIELTQGPGYDNRPKDDEEHERLHANE